MFQKKPTPQEALRQGKRDVAQAARGLEREVANLQAEEKKLLVEIKKTAKTGNQAAARVLARELVRVRGQIEKLHKSKAQIRGISTHAQVAQANVTVAGAMRSAGTVMGNVNKQMDVASAARMAADFQRESAKMDHVQDMVGGALDDALDSSDTEEEADDITNQILDEIGIDTSAQLSSVPAKRLPAAAAAQGETSRAQAAWQEEEEDDLQRRFAALHSR
ncbi:hypothetical protein CLOP_g14932 [Closterium sp. NIES-67]|nr:hypothetical protein CLOP_g14932 [Closterium sp. NIES-67]